MTVCTTLAEKRKGGKVITASKRIDKDSTICEYTITVSENGFSVDVIKTAKSTWKKRFNEM